MVLQYEDPLYCTYIPYLPASTVRGSFHVPSYDSASSVVEVVVVVVVVDTTIVIPPGCHYSLGLSRRQGQVSVHSSLPADQSPNTTTRNMVPGRQRYLYRPQVHR